MTLSIKYEYVLSVIGFQTVSGNGSERVELGEILINPLDGEVLLTDKVFPIEPNTSIPFSIKYKTDEGELADFIRKDIKSKNLDLDDAIGANVSIKKMTFNFKIIFFNPDQNSNEEVKTEFIKDGINNIGFSLPAPR